MASKWHLPVQVLIQFSYAYTDYAVARAFRSRVLTNVFIDLSYDSVCSWSVNAPTRFKEHIPDLSDLIQKTRFSIDALHVNDHQDRCMYLFSASYHIGSGHFHGVGTEQYWPENNQMAGQTRQMNPGHRHDKITEHHGEWNWKKMVRHGMLFSLVLSLAGY